VKKFSKVLLAALIVALAVGGWIWMHPSPERAIRRQMEKLQENLAVKPGEGNFARAAAVNRILSVFAPNVQINTEGMPHMGDAINGQTELQQSLFAARTQLQGEVNFFDLHMVVGAEATNATVTFTASAKLANQNEPYAQDIRAHFEKIEGKWLIARVEPVGLEKH
jgi:hypothetical protein